MGGDYFARGSRHGAWVILIPRVVGYPINFAEGV